MALQTKNTMSTLYRRVFAPTGVVRDDAREYVPGDDTRFMNWPITAKMNAPFVDGVRADRGNDIVFAVDFSESMRFGTRRQSKLSLATDIMSTMVQLVEMNGDRAGLMLFSSLVEKFCHPRRNGMVFRHIIQRKMESNARRRTNLLCALRFLNGVVKKRSSIVLMCDAFALAANRKSALSQFHILRRKHDVTLIAIVDDNDMLHGKLGRIVVEDSESGEIFEIDSDDTLAMESVGAKYSAYKKIIFGDVADVGVKVFIANTRDSATNFLFALLRRAGSFNSPIGV
jgi:uncharacterized protein (DUF58 family)